MPQRSATAVSKGFTAFVCSTDAKMRIRFSESLTRCFSSGNSLRGGACSECSKNVLLAVHLLILKRRGVLLSTALSGSIALEAVHRFAEAACLSLLVLSCVNSNGGTSRAMECRKKNPGFFGKSRGFHIRRRLHHKPQIKRRAKR